MLKLLKSKPAMSPVRTSIPMQYRVAAAGMTVALAWRTFFFAISRWNSQLLPSKPAARDYRS